MKTLVILIALIAGLSGAQDSKAAKTEPAPAAKPAEITVLGRKVALSVPADWTDTKAPSTFDSGTWKPVKGWQHPTIKGMALHIYGVEAKDLTAAAMAQKWIESAGKAKPEVLVSVTGKNKTLKGLDTEVEMKENETYSFYWMRAIAIPPKDKVLIVLAEASPLDRGKFEQIVLEMRPILDSVLDPSGKDPWRRDLNVTVTCGELVARLTAPAGWEYGRDGREGSPTWSEPGSRQKILLGFPLRYARFRAQESVLTQFAPMVYKAMVDAQAALVEQCGKTLAKADAIGHDQASDTTTVFDTPETGPLWTRRRLFLDGSNLVSLDATHPLTDLDSLPPDAAQKQVAAAMQSFKTEIVRSSK